VLEGADLASLVGGQATMARTTSSLRLSVQKVLSDHALWAESNGASGARAELREEDLSQIDLSGIDLNGADLRACNFSGANLSKGVFILTDFTSANLSGITAHDADFSGANLSEVNLRDAQLRNAKFDPIELKGPDGTLLGRAAQNNLTGADLFGVVLENAMLQRIVSDT
jgi:uncharacterized protein YjbI with pentapeptide repeats